MSYSSGLFLLVARFRGGNQGLIKIITHGVDKDPACKPPVAVHESKLSARLDGGQSVGIVVMSKATQMAATKVCCARTEHDWRIYIYI